MSGLSRFLCFKFCVLYLLTPNPGLTKEVMSEATGEKLSCDGMLESIGTAVLSDAGGDQVLCNITSTQLDAQTGPGTWSTTSPGVTIVNPSSPTTQVTDLNRGSNVFTWTTSTATDDVEIFVADVPPAPAISSTGSSVCSGTRVILSVNNLNPNYTYRWYKAGNPLSIIGDLVLVGTAASGAYQLQAIDMATNCESELSAVEMVTIGARPSKPTINASTTLSCAGNPVTLTASEAPLSGSYLWSKNGLPQSFNSRSIVLSDPSESGDYSVILLSAQGCNSDASDPTTLTIESLPPTPTISTSGNVICADGSQVELTSDQTAPSLGTYIWLKDGTPLLGEVSQKIVLERFDESGSYSVSIVDGDGARCASLPSSAQNVEISQLPSVAQVGDNQQLCDEIATALVAVGPSVGRGTWNTSSAGIVIDDPNDPNSIATGLSVGTHVFSWQVNNGSCIGTPVDMEVEVFSAPSVAITEADKLICDQTSTTISATPPANGIGEWTVVDGFATLLDSSTPQTTIQDLAPSTEVVLSWTVRNGACIENTDELRVQVGQSPAAATAGPDLQLCNETTTQLAAATPAIGEGQWTVLAGTATLVNPTNPATTVNDLIPGQDVALRWTVANSCGVNTQDITIINEAPPDLANAGPDVELCGTNSTILSGSGRGGRWTLISGTATILNDSDAQSTVSGLAVGANVLRYSIEGGVCDGTEDEVTITVFQEPGEAIAGDDLFVCDGETTVVLAAQPPLVGTGRWTIVNGNATLQNPQDPSTRVTGLQPGEAVLRWSVDNGNCPATVDDLVINVFPSPGVANNEVEVCLGEAAQLEAVGGEQYQWQPAIGLSDASIANPLAGPVETTLYTVDIINANCVSTSVSVNVIVRPVPTLAISQDTIIFANEQVELFASGASAYQWMPATGLDDPTSDSPIASPAESTQYIVMGTNEFDCETSAQVTVSVSDNFEVFVPGLFSPNGDQMNDVLYVNTLGIRTFEFRVFDRTGREMFSTTNREQGWDGTFNGVEQSMDSYVYYVVAETVSGNRIRRKGSIQLVR